MDPDFVNETNQSQNQDQNSTQPPTQQDFTPKQQDNKKPSKAGKIIKWIVVVLVIIGSAAGVYFWQQQKIADQKAQADKEIANLKSELSKLKSSTTKDKSANETKNDVSKDPTIGWTAFKSADGKVSFRRPSAWLTAKYPELCDSNILLFGTTEKNVGKCGSDSQSQIAITWRSGNTCELSTNLYEIKSKTTTSTSNGVSGEKTIGIAKSSIEGIGPQPGTETTQYCFVSKGFEYIVELNRLPGEPDISNDVELLVKNTLVLN